MALFSKAELQALVSDQASPCVSIYLPTHTKGAETQQDPIQLKNQLSKAEDMLAKRGLSKTEIEDLLSPARELISNQDFWQHQNSGLALFMSPGKFRYYKSPMDLTELTTVGEAFHLKPLLSLLANDGQFYVLATSQNKVSLYQATRDSVQAVDLGETPLDIATALQYDDPEESIQGHSTSRNSGKGSSAQIKYSGQGSGKDSENTDILRFFQLVADGVQDALDRKSVV